MLDFYWFPLFVASHALFSPLCVATASAVGSNHNDVAGKVLDVWCDKMACVTAPERYQQNGTAN